MSRFGRTLTTLLIASLGIVLSGCGGSAGSDPTNNGSNSSGGGSSQGQSTVQHLVIIEMQNASFDHFFGTFQPSGGGSVDGLRPGVPGYVQTDANGNSVSPSLLKNLAPPALPEGHDAFTKVMDGGAMDKFAFYNGDISMGYYDGTLDGMSTLWNYAQQYAIADNFFSSVIGEAPTNMLYMVSASDNNTWYSVQPAFGPCNKSDPAATPLTFQNVGDQLTAKNVSWAAYQEDLSDCTKYSPLHNPFQYFTSTQGVTRDYSEFATDLSSGKLAAVSFIFPNNRDGMHPGFAPITYGADFIDNIVKQLQASSVWNSTAVIVIWDSPGGWYDHVPPPTVDSQGLNARVPLIVISPLAKKGYVSHTQMDFVSILRYIQKNWGLPSLNSRNDQSNDLSDLFQ